MEGSFKPPAMNGGAGNPIWTATICPRVGIDTFELLGLFWRWFWGLLTNMAYATPHYYPKY